MKIIKCLKTTLVSGAIFFTGSAFAYNAGVVGEDCKPPKFYGFVPAEQIKGEPVPEVEPESEIGFTVSGSADPTTILAEAKKQKLKLNIVDRHSFYLVTAKLPAGLNGKYARINLKVKSQKGECVAKDGWLIKVNKTTEVAEPAPIEE